jgi:hypothetical protein
MRPLPATSAVQPYIVAAALLLALGTWAMNPLETRVTMIMMGAYLVSQLGCDEQASEQDGAQGSCGGQGLFACQPGGQLSWLQAQAAQQNKLVSTAQGHGVALQALPW